MVFVKIDEFGMVVFGLGGLEDVFVNWDSSKGKCFYLMYIVILGYNLIGIFFLVECKKEIYVICSKYDVIIIEDEFYWYF